MHRTTQRPLQDTVWFRRLFGLLCAVPLIGFLSLPAAGILAALLAPVKAVTRWPPHLKLVIASAVLGALAFAVSTLINGVDMASNSAASFLVVALFVIGFANTVKDTATAAHLLMWIAVATFLFYLVVGYDATKESLEGLWKYGIASPLVLILLYLCCSKSTRNKWVIPVLLTFAVTSLFLGFRSHALICMLVILHKVAVSSKMGSRINVFRVAVAGGALVAIGTLLPAAINDGVFGRDLQLRSLAQTGDGTPAILGGRTEPPLSLALIFARPLFGWGNVQLIDHDAINAGHVIAQSLGMKDPSFYLTYWIRPDGFVSLHSVLLGSWAEGGVLAAVLPFVLVGIFTAATWKVRGEFSPLVAFVCIQGIWDLIFSPWAGNRTVLLAITCIIAVWAIWDSKNAVQPIPPQKTTARPTYLKARWRY